MKTINNLTERFEDYFGKSNDIELELKVANGRIKNDDYPCN
jgi:hypothetical protein